MQVVLVYLQPFWRNSLLKCASQPKIAKNSLKPLYWGFKVIHVNISKKLIASACFDKQHVLPICNHFHVRRANNGRIMSFQEGCPSFTPSFMGTPFTQWHEILSQNTRDTKLSYSENPKSLSQLVLKRYWVATDIWRDRQNYHS